MGEEILKTQPMEPGWSLPQTRGLLLGKVSLKAAPAIKHSARPWCVEAFPHGHASHGNPLTGPDLFAPVDSAPLHLHQDPQSLWFTGSRILWPWPGLGLSRRSGWDLRPGPPVQWDGTGGLCWEAAMGILRARE